MLVDTKGLFVAVIFDFRNDSTEKAKPKWKAADYEW